jgi:hypothetical protein
MQRLPDRLSAATQMEDIFERNPAWKRASRRLSTGANDHINVRSTTGPRSTVDVDVRNCWEGGRADAVTALNAHPAYSVSVETFIDAAAEPGVTMVRPRGVLVGVKLSPEELNDDREVGNGSGCERDDEVLAAGDGASASLLEDIISVPVVKEQDHVFNAAKILPHAADGFIGECGKATGVFFSVLG